MSERTPASISSCIRISIGCMKLYAAPGASFSRACFIAVTSSSLERCDGHSETGFSMTYTSLWSIAIGSVATSGLPVRHTTVSTSGNCLSTVSMISLPCSDSLIEIPGTRYIITRIEPSSNRGRNSAPRNGMTPSDTTKRRAATAAMAIGERRARLRIGLYAELILRMSQVVFSVALWRNAYHPSTGISVSAITSDAPTAKRTVMAMGSNILPSTPVSVRMGT